VTLPESEIEIPLIYLDNQLIYVVGYIQDKAFSFVIADEL